MAVAADFPDYQNPPLVEVAMSIQFDPPKGLSVAHLGAFWSRHQNELPVVKAAQPISPAHEDFGTEGQWIPPSLRLGFSDEPVSRLQMTSLDDEWMWQVQLDRLVVNWRMRSHEYPRFGTTLERFNAAWDSWADFLQSQELRVPVPNLWDLTYVNRIPSGDLWMSPADWPAIFPGLWGGPFSASSDLVLCGLRGQWVWDRADPPARLHVETRPSRTTEKPHRDLLMVNLTARGPIIQVERDGSPKDAKANTNVQDPKVLISDGMNLGHELIVFMFDEIASTRAQKYWERQR